MFELPDSKRVRREDLYASASDEDVNVDNVGDQVETELRGKLSARLSGLLNFHEPLELKSVEAAHDQDGADDEPLGDEDVDQNPGEVAFEFRLFRDESPSHHKIVLTSQDEELRKAGNGGFVVPRRPQSHYVAAEPDAEAWEKFKFSAVTADYIKEDAQRRRWGLEKPWRVIRIPSAADVASRGSHPKTGNEQDRQVAERKRKRPGKKRRIILRTREKAKQEKQEAAQKQLAEKEAHLREKKTRLNRQKKLKRRAKEKEKKAAADGEGAASEPSSRVSSPG